MEHFNIHNEGEELEPEYRDSSIEHISIREDNDEEDMDGADKQNTIKA